jgi:two-component system cell cycle response regulator
MARILVIDDDDSLLKVMSLMLKRAGHQVIVRDTAHEGIETAFREPIDLAIIDVMMPEMSGYQVCNILRHDARTSQIPLLILTALDGHEEEENAEDAGADAFVTKPVTLDLLRSSVEQLLKTGPRNVSA